MPLPIMLEEEDRKIYEKLEAPKTIVLRYGHQRKIAELPYDGTAKPGCGSKLVIRTDRGTEVAEMLTTTCSNSGCGKSVSRQQMLDYIKNSGGKDYPFTNQGKVLRVATPDDMREQAHLDQRKPDLIRACKRLINELQLRMKLVEVELLLGGERVIFYYNSEEWVDFRELVRLLASEVQSRVEMCQVNDREEARLVADYEKCGQHCCCKQFLKVLKPISMRSAKVQKATLDPQKISGRCGRLMCCLRYEDQTYTDLKKKLPHRKSVVETEDGIGIVLDTQILTQLALVKIGMQPPAAYPVENIRVLNKEETRAFEQQEAEAQRQREERAWNRRGGDRPAPGAGPSAGSGGGAPTEGSRARSPRDGGAKEQGPRDAAREGRHREGKPADAAAPASPPLAPADDTVVGGTTPPPATPSPVTGAPVEGNLPPAEGEGSAAGEGRSRRRRRRRGRGGAAGTEGGSDRAEGAADEPQEPRRPRPGAPLADHEVRSREGTGSADLPAGPGTPEAPAPGADAASGGEGRSRRRRRRRRPRGGGGEEAAG